jgi:glycerol-3-phosphate acyltransferase PlsY
MNKILKVFRYAGFSMIFIALVSIVGHLFSAYDDYKDGLISVNVVEKNVKSEPKIVSGAKFTSMYMGTYQFKPTFMQSVLLSDNAISNIGASIVFYLILGVVILIIAYTRPSSVEKLTESTLWQFVVAGGVLFMVLKATVFVLVNKYMLHLTNNQFGVSSFHKESINFSMLSLVAILTIIYELLSYSRKLKLENDLTI